MVDKWFKFLDLAHNVSFDIGLIIGMVSSLLLLLFYAVLSPLLMWFPYKEVKHPTLMDKITQAIDKEV